MSTTTKGRELLNRGTALEIERFLQARRLALSNVIRRGLEERQEAPAEEGDAEATASRTLESEVRATLVDRASRAHSDDEMDRFDDQLLAALGQLRHLRDRLAAAPAGAPIAVATLAGEVGSGPGEAGDGASDDPVEAPPGIPGRRYSHRRIDAALAASGGAIG